MKAKHRKQLQKEESDRLARTLLKTKKVFDDYDMLTRKFYSEEISDTFYDDVFMGTIRPAQNWSSNMQNYPTGFNRLNLIDSNSSDEIPPSFSL